MRWADHVVMIASLEQLHHHWAEAAHLFALAQPAYVDAHGDESLELAELIQQHAERVRLIGWLQREIAKESRARQSGARRWGPTSAPGAPRAPARASLIHRDLTAEGDADTPRDR